MISLWTKGESRNLPDPADSTLISLADDSVPPVRGLLHRPLAPSGEALVLAHGAGSNGRAPLLGAVAATFAQAAGFTVLRCDLPYRQKRPHGPPFPGEAAQDREGLRNAVSALRRVEPAGSCRGVLLGGHSYGGRQASILVAEDPAIATCLILLSYPLHPPRRPEQLRTAHFPSLRTPSFFVLGTRDLFGSPEEMTAALKLIPARTSVLTVEDAGHDLGFGRKAARPGSADEVARRIVEAFRLFCEEARSDTDRTAE